MRRVVDEDIEMVVGFINLGETCHFPTLENSEFAIILVISDRTWRCDELIIVMASQTPEQKARALIDKKLVDEGWVVQSKDGIGFNAARGVAIREYTSDTGPMDYRPMVDGKPCGDIEAKKAEEADKRSARGGLEPS